MTNYGTLSVDLDALATMLGTLNSIQSDLSTQAGSIVTMSGNLSSIISGSSVATFEGNFAAWAKSLHDVAEDIAAAYADLNNLATAVDTQTGLLNAITYTD